MKIVMWSGPRNLSTAMMYSFGARPDCFISDEPFYAAYLQATGADHPMRADVLAAHEADPAKVSTYLSGPVPDGRAHWYQKHMPHHMEAHFPLDWASECVHIHLIRHPARVIASYRAKRENPQIADLGYDRHLTFFERFPGPVIESSDVRHNPSGMLSRLCAEIGLRWDPAMLNWPAGGNAADGVWAKHWYGAVHNSTTFAGPEGPLPEVSGPLFDAALPVYQAMAAHRLMA